MKHKVQNAVHMNIKK